MAEKTATLVSLARQVAAAFQKFDGKIHKLGIKIEKLDAISA
jgi:hypothetical protein